MLRNRFSSWKVVVSFGVAGESWLAVARSGEMTGRAVRTKGRTWLRRAGVAVRERSISDAFRAGVRRANGRSELSVTPSWRANGVAAVSAERVSWSVRGSNAIV